MVVHLYTSALFAAGENIQLMVLTMLKSCSVAKNRLY